MATYRQTTAFSSIPACHKISVSADTIHFLWYKLIWKGLLEEEYYRKSNFDKTCSSCQTTVDKQGLPKNCHGNRATITTVIHQSLLNRLIWLSYICLRLAFCCFVQFRSRWCFSSDFGILGLAFEILHRKCQSNNIENGLVLLLC